MNRRTFIGGVAAFTQAASAASDRVNVAMIGVRGRGRSLAGSIATVPNANIAALCDVDDSSYAVCAKALDGKVSQMPRHVKDLRRVLDDKSIDAVFIATPDHWHAPAAILACAAGKDVYVEKPCSHNLREGRLMVEAARKYNRVVQHGTQSRSRPSTIRGIEYARSGKIGKVLMAKAWNVQLRDNIGHKEDGPVPAGIDFDTWTGPAPLLPFNENRYHYKWHWNWNYGTGDIGNDGVHQMDIARWALGVEIPKRASGWAKKVFFDDDQQTPDSMNLTFDFGDRSLIFEMRIWNPYGLEGQDNGVAIYGTDGMVQIGRWTREWGYRVYDSKGALVMDQSKGGDGPEVQHIENFLACVKSRKRPNADIEIGHTSTILCHLGNIVARTGRNVEFDGAREQVVGDADAGKYLRRQYRPHWSVPKGA